MVCGQPRVHTVKVAITNDKDNIFGPVRILYKRNPYQVYAKSKWHLLTFQERGQGEHNRNTPQVISARQTFPRGTDDHCLGPRRSRRRKDGICIGTIQRLMCTVRQNKINNKPNLLQIRLGSSIFAWKTVFQILRILWRRKSRVCIPAWVVYCSPKSSENAG